MTNSTPTMVATWVRAKDHNGNTTLQMRWHKPLDVTTLTDSITPAAA